MSRAVPLNEFLLKNSIDLEHVIFDGTLRRFSRRNKGGDECWIICFDSNGFQSVVFGDWSNNIKEVWHSKTQRLTIDQHKELVRRLDFQRKQYELSRKDLNEKAKLKAQEIIQMPSVFKEHEYCLKKKIKPEYGAKVVFYKEENSLVIPITNKDLQIVNLQVINGSGKKFLYGGQISECFLLMESFDESKENKIFICEGYATGWSLAKALDDLNYSYQIYCCFTANNIKKVISSVLKDKKEVIICADNDRFKDKNTGLEVARDCEVEFRNVSVFVPEFGDLDKGTDANDISVFIGEDELQKQLSSFFKKENVTTAAHFNFYNGDVPLYHEMADYFFNKLNVIYNPIFWCYFDGKKYNKVDEGWVVNQISKLCNRKNKPFELSQFKNQIQARCYAEQKSFLNPLNGFINFNNGVLDVNNFSLLPHDKKYNFFYCLDRDYVENKSCENWINFLNKIMFNDRDSINLIQEIFGYCLLGGEQFMQKVFLFIGSGQNGKGTVTKILAEVVGQFNCSYVPLEALSNPFSAIRIKDKMVNISGEISKGVLQSDTFKKWSAGEEIPMAYKHKDEFDCQVNARGIVTCNNMPVFDEVTHAIDRRFIMLNFKYELGENEKVNNRLFDELKEEISGITCWALEGLKRLLSQEKPEFTIGQNSIETMTSFRLNRDNVARFCAEHLTYTGQESDKIIFNDVYLSYLNFCENERSNAVQKEEMSKRLSVYFKNNKFEITRKVIKDKTDKKSKLRLVGVSMTPCDVERSNSASKIGTFRNFYY